MTGPMTTADDDEARQRPEVQRYTVTKRMTLQGVEVAGVPVMVREDAVEHLTRVNNALAITRLALHKIIMNLGDTSIVAWRALEDIKEDAL